MDERKITGTVDLSRFYLRRILRLIPALLVFIGTVAILSHAGYLDRIKAYEFVAAILYIRNFVGRSESLVHLWSLSLEEQFYSIWPPLAKKIRTNWLFWGSISFTVAMSIWRGIALYFKFFGSDYGLYYTRPYFRLDSILVGCCIALLLQNKIFDVPQFVNTIPLPIIWILLILWAIVGHSLCLELHITLQMLGVTWILYRAVIETKFVILTSSILRFAGKISYSLYLWQQIFLIVRKPYWPFLHSFPLDLVATVVMATMSYFLIERPFLRLKDRFSSRRSAANIDYSYRSS